jgi:hypothetical protein
MRYDRTRARQEATLARQHAHTARRLPGAHRAVASGWATCPTAAASHYVREQARGVNMLGRAARSPGRPVGLRRGGALGWVRGTDSASPVDRRRVT